MPPKMPANGVPELKNVRIDVEKTQVILMVNMGGMAMPMKLDAADIISIAFMPCTEKKLFRQVNTEKLVFTMDKMPKMSPPPGMPAMGDDAGGGGMPAPPQDVKPELVIKKDACGKEFDAYKPLLERFCKNNNITFSKE